jgi:hypothetical protein
MTTTLPPTEVVVDERRALDLLRQAVAGRENFVYRPVDDGLGLGRACRYEHAGAPSCLVGQVLALTGVTVAQLRELDHLDEGDVASLEVPWLDLTSGARRVLQAAQAAQDHGTTWGQALELATEAAMTRGA